MKGDTAIKTHLLRKEYDDVVALQSLDLEINKGEIYGLIGPNGAGKTTLLKILATVIRPDFGTASVCGLDVERHPLDVRRAVGYMPDFFALYENVTAEDFLTYFGLAFGLDGAPLTQRVGKLLDDTDLTSKRAARISELSRGMKQRLVLAKTLVHDPPVLLLDEPFSGLDPKSRKEIRDVLNGLNKTGKTIIISSHVLAEMSDFCTSIGILEKGILRLSGAISEINTRAMGARKVEIEVAGDADRARDIIAVIDGAAIETCEGTTIKFTLNGDRERIAAVNETLVAAGIGVLAIREERDSLEDIYFQVAAHEVQ